MVTMAGQQQHHTSRYPSLLVTVKHDPDKRSGGNEIYSNPRTRHLKDHSCPSSFQAKNIFYNSHHRHQQQSYLTRPPHTSPRRQQPSHYPPYDRLHYQYQHQPIRPLMDIKDNLFSLHPDFDDNENDDKDDEEKKIAKYIAKPREPKQRGQYRNRKAELDWDHAFDLDLIDLYITHPDPDSRSLTSTNSSSDHSFSSF